MLSPSFGERKNAMLDKWYGNIGKKIKMLAKIAFVAGAVFFIIYGICIIFWGATFVKLNLLNSKMAGSNTVVWGICTMVLGPIAAFVATWLLYAFGQLVENTEYLRYGMPCSPISTAEGTPVHYNVAAGGVVLHDRTAECVTIPRVCGDAVATTIGKHGFYGASNLVSVTLPGTIQKIEDGAFYCCYNLKEIRYEGTLDDWNHIHKGEDWDAYTGDYNIVFRAPYDA
jgi:hypothetical protein